MEMKENSKSTTTNEFVSLYQNMMGVKKWRKMSEIIKLLKREEVLK